MNHEPRIMNLGLHHERNIMTKLSKRAKANTSKVDANKSYTITEALEIVKQTANTKFVGSVEVHVRTLIDPKKTDQQVRGSVSLPHGTGKTKKIAAFVSESKEKLAKDAGASIVGGEELIKEIKETEKTDFDIAVAEPSIMPKLAGIAKILGTRGLMPNPKTGTVGEDIAGIIKEISAGKVTFKNDNSGNIHQIIGKTNFTPEQLAANFDALLGAVKASKSSTVKGSFIGSISINASMGPGVKVKA
jgi:large subunit ribosomal protein L1